jgi:CO/xanthine dehydrogenase Mo-binding subunit
VLAEDPKIAEAAAQEISIDYEELPAVLNEAKTLKRRRRPSPMSRSDPPDRDQRARGALIADAASALIPGHAVSAAARAVGRQAFMRT